MQTTESRGLFQCCFQIELSVLFLIFLLLLLLSSAHSSCKWEKETCVAGFDPTLCYESWKRALWFECHRITLLRWFPLYDVLPESSERCRVSKMAASIRRLWNVGRWWKFDDCLRVGRRWSHFQSYNHLLSRNRSVLLILGGCLSAAAFYETRKRALTEVKTTARTKVRSGWSPCFPMTGVERRVISWRK